MYVLAGVAVLLLAGIIPVMTAIFGCAVYTWFTGIDVKDPSKVIGWSFLFWFVVFMIACVKDYQKKRRAMRAYTDSLGK